MADRRCTNRTPLRKRVRFGTFSIEFWGYISNISEKGVRIEAHKVFSPRSRITINIYMGMDGLETGTMEEVIKLEGVVIWASPALSGTIARMGIKLLKGADGIETVKAKV